VHYRFSEWTEEQYMEDIRLNSLFSLFLTRAFLPSLRATARARPTLVVFVGSFADEMPMARLVLYSAAKYFDRRVALGLHADERFNTPDEKAISFMYVGIATVSSGLYRGSTNLFRPSSKLFAEKLVGTFGCGRQVVVPYVGHYLIKLVFIGLLPESLVAGMSHKSAHDLAEKTMKESKPQS
jgi:short-subunit dehydrogenase